MNESREKSIRFELDLLNQRLATKIVADEVDWIIQQASNLNYPYGLDVYYSLYLAINLEDSWFLRQHRLCNKEQPIEDLVIMMYTLDNLNFERGYDELSAYILKRSLMYCIPF